MKTSSRYLINEEPIFFLPSLAKEIGLSEAILLQKIHGWLQCTPHDADDKRWVYNTYKSWQQQLPFMTELTIKRAVKKMVDLGILEVGNFNKTKFDRTNWYSINYDKIDEIAGNTDSIKMIPREYQNDTISSYQNDTMDSNKMIQPIPIYNNNNNNNNIYIVQFEKFYEAYPKKQSKKDTEKWFIKHKPSEDQFNLMMNKLEEFKKCKQWQNKQYIPMPTTWLNQERWNDEIDDSQVENTTDWSRPDYKRSDITIVGL